jgi:hypothetical protein
MQHLLLKTWIAMLWLVPCLYPQTTSSSSDLAQQQPVPRATVTVAADRAFYRLKQEINLRITLTNTGSVPFYISKSFGQAGGGISGFYYYLSAVSLAATANCQGNGDRYGGESRSPTAILKEDYLLLSEGQSVSTVIKVDHCEYPKAGKYKIRAEYAPYDWNMRVVSSINGLKFPVLQEKVKSQAIIITVVK